ncbi:hypothetical protein C0J26_28450 [Pseudomonas baetica]|nr:hypothetical protein C0J26_28450 [Pseudomonas baetica]
MMRILCNEMKLKSYQFFCACQLLEITVFKIFFSCSSSFLGGIVKAPANEKINRDARVVVFVNYQ